MGHVSAIGRPTLRLSRAGTSSFKDLPRKNEEEKPRRVQLSQGGRELLVGWKTRDVLLEVETPLIAHLSRVAAVQRRIASGNA